MVSLISLLMYTYKVHIAASTNKCTRERQRMNADAMSELSRAYDRLLRRTRALNRPLVESELTIKKLKGREYTEVRLFEFVRFEHVGRLKDR